MELIKKVNALVLGLAVLLVFGCKKDDLGNKVCSLTRLIEPQYQYDYAYDLQGKLTSISYTLRNHQSPVARYSYEYDGAGRIVEKKINDITRSRYFYDAKNLLTRAEHFVDTLNTVKLEGYTTFEYNSQNRIVRSNYFIPSGRMPVSYFLYTYLGGANDIVIIRQFDAGFTPAVQIYKSESHFDSKKKPTALPYPLMGELISISDHNITFFSDSVGGGLNTTINYTYDYNSSGYPVKRKAVASGEQFNIGETVFEYNCR